MHNWHSRASNKQARGRAERPRSFSKGANAAQITPYRLNARRPRRDIIPRPGGIGDSGALLRAPTRSYHENVIILTPVITAGKPRVSRLVRSFLFFRLFVQLRTFLFSDQRSPGSLSGATKVRSVYFFAEFLSSFALRTCFLTFILH